MCWYFSSRLDSAFALGLSPPSPLSPVFVAFAKTVRFVGANGVLPTSVAATRICVDPQNRVRALDASTVIFNSPSFEFPLGSSAIRGRFSNDDVTVSCDSTEDSTHSSSSDVSRLGFARDSTALEPAVDSGVDPGVQPGVEPLEDPARTNLPTTQLTTVSSRLRTSLALEDSRISAGVGSSGIIDRGAGGSATSD